MTSRPDAATGARRLRRSGRAGRGGRARRVAAPGLAGAAAAILLAACASAGTGQGHQAAASRGMTVSVRNLPGIGTVLVDRSGKTLYSPQQEADGTIACTGACLSFWFPVRASAGKALRAPGGAGAALGTVHRADDGLTQLTFHGRPLYTFRLDTAPGQAHGNRFTDRFGGVTFVWQAVTTSASGTPARPAQSANPSGGYSYQGGSSGY